MLSDHVSKITIDANNPHELAGDILKDCKSAKVVQSAWGQTTKRIVKKDNKPEKANSNIVKAREMIYVFSRQAYTALKNCEFLQNKKNAKHLTEQQIIDELNASTNPPAEITSYILIG